MRLFVLSSGEKVYRTSTTNLARDAAMRFSRDASDATRQYFAGFGSELREKFRIAHIHSAGRDINSAVGHGSVAGSEADSALDALEFVGHRC